jgi:DNA-binding transcriptional regulator GbsR (MarR family)
MPPKPPSKPDDPVDPVAFARKTLLEGVGQEVADSFPGITRLGGQIIAALYLADGPRSMDALSLELGRSKSNIFANLRGLEAAGLVRKERPEGARHDLFALRGKYPDVIVGAYLGRLRRVVGDKQALCQKALGILGEATGPEAEAIRAQLHTLARKYDKFATLFNELLPALDGPIDLEALALALPIPVLASLAAVARQTLGLPDLAAREAARESGSGE